MQPTRHSRRAPSGPFKVPLTFRSFGADGGHLVVESWWKELIVPLIVDTGSTHSLLHAGLFLREPKAAPSSGRIIDASSEALLVLGGGGNFPSHEEPLLVQGMRIGGMALPSELWSLINLGPIRNHYRQNGYAPPCGLIGMDLLRRMGAVLHCGFEEPYLLLQNFKQRGLI